jgi:pentatricopeptide repeat protein
MNLLRNSRIIASTLTEPPREISMNALNAYISETTANPTPFPISHYNRILSRLPKQKQLSYFSASMNGVYPDHTTYSILLLSIISQSPDRDNILESVSELLSSPSSEFERIIKIWNKLSSAHKITNVSLYNIIIYACVRFGKIHLVPLYKRQMELDGVRPDVETTYCFFVVCLSLLIPS